MAAAKQYQWEATHIGAIAGVMVILALQAHLTGTRNAPNVNEQGQFQKLATAPTLKAVHPVPASDAAALEPTHPITSPPSDPSEVTVGPSGISNRYKLQRVNRKKQSAHDVLTVSLHVESLATEGLVSPFESGMFEISNPGAPPLKPSTPFRSPVPSGNSRDRDITFNVPSTLDLDHATLRIHYYNYENEIPLTPTPPAAPSPP